MVEITGFMVVGASVVEVSSPFVVPVSGVPPKNALTIAISAIFALGAFAFYKYNIKINVIVLSGIVSVTCGMILAFVIYLFKKNDNKLLDNVD